LKEVTTCGGGNKVVSSEHWATLQTVIVYYRSVKL